MEADGVQVRVPAALLRICVSLSQRDAVSNDAWP